MAKLLIWVNCLTSFFNSTLISESISWVMYIRRSSEFEKLERKKDATRRKIGRGSEGGFVGKMGFKSSITQIRDVEYFEIREVLRCILHTIFFHRALGLVRPKDIDLELFEITYVQCGDAELEKKVDEKIDQFIDRVEKHPNKKNQICLSFFEVKNKQATWFTHKVEHLYWEQWYINLNVAQHPKSHSGKSHHSKLVVDPGESASDERNARRATLESTLHEVLFQIIKFVNEKKDHIPPIPNMEGVSFPYEITISSSSDSAFGMDMFKRMLQTGHPTMLS